MMLILTAAFSAVAQHPSIPDLFFSDLTLIYFFHSIYHHLRCCIIYLLQLLMVSWSSLKWDVPYFLSVLSLIYPERLDECCAYGGYSADTDWMVMTALFCPGGRAPVSSPGLISLLLSRSLCSSHTCLLAVPQTSHSPSSCWLSLCLEQALPILSHGLPLHFIQRFLSRLPPLADWMCALC